MSLQLTWKPDSKSVQVLERERRGGREGGREGGEGKRKRKTEMERGKRTH